MTDFMAFDATSHPIIRAEDDYNNLLDHAWWRGIGWYIRINGAYYEAINMQTGKIDYGGSGNVGAIDGTDAAAVINAALAACGTAGGVVDLGRQYFDVDDQIVFPNTLGVGEDEFVALVGNQATLANTDTTLADHMVELDAVTTPVNYSFYINGIQFYPGAKDPLYYNIYVKDALNVHIQDCVVGWNGIKLEDCSIVWLNNLYIVDSYNEALWLDNTTYVLGDNIMMDNCGGYGGNPYDCFKMDNGSHKLHFNNFHLYGAKGAMGGQQTGLNLSVAGSAEFSNFYIEGFKGASIAIASSTHLTFTNFNIIGGDSFGINIAPIYGDCKGITISNFDIDPPLASYGITGYAQNGYDCTNIAISNGVIHDAANGVGIYLDDDGGADFCKYWTVNNVVFDTLNFGFAEGAGSISDYNQLTGGTMIAVTNPASLVGANSRVRNVMGYRNEGGGVATMANGTATLDIDPGFHASIDFTATAPIVTLAGQHADVLDLIWAVKDADEITVTSQAVTTGDRLFNYYIAMPEVFRL